MQRNESRFTLASRRKITDKIQRVSSSLCANMRSGAAGLSLANTSITEFPAPRRIRAQRCSGYRRIQGAIANLGDVLAHSTVANILKRHGIEPATERNRQTTRKEFLTRHWHQIVATDFSTLEVWTCSGLTRFVVLFFMDLKTRRVEIGGIASSANGLWMN